MKLGQYIKRMEEPSFDELIAVIRPAFELPFIKYGLDQYRHSGYYYNRNDYQNALNKGAIWFGAYDKGELMGCVSVLKKSEATWRIGKLAVHPDFQHCGVGKSLLNEAERFVFNRGASKLSLSCLKDDADLVKFYESNGYLSDGQKVYKKTGFTIGFYVKKMNHLIDLVTNLADHYPVDPIVCDETLYLKDQILLIYHPDEVDKKTNTGHLLGRLLPEHVKEWIWHRNTVESFVDSLSEGFLNVLVYPSDDAREVSEYVSNVDSRIRWIFIDATWQQSQKMLNQSPSLMALDKVRLSSDYISRYTLRKNQRAEGLCTLESVGHVLGESGFDTLRTQLASRLEDWLKTLSCK